MCPPTAAEPFSPGRIRTIRAAGTQSRSQSTYRGRQAATPSRSRSTRRLWRRSSPTSARRPGRISKTGRCRVRPRRVNPLWKWHHRLCARWWPCRRDAAPNGLGRCALWNREPCLRSNALLQICRRNSPCRGNAIEPRNQSDLPNRLHSRCRTDRRSPNGLLSPRNVSMFSAGEKWRGVKTPANPSATVG